MMRIAIEYSSKNIIYKLRDNFMRRIFRKIRQQSFNLSYYNKNIRYKVS